MTIQPFDDDELVSVYLDGEATPDEVARVESDPVLLARVEALRTAVALTAQPVPPAPATMREAHIAAALAVADSVLPPPPAPPPPAPAPPDEPPSPVVDLAARRRRINRTWLAAAAAIAVAVLAIPLVLRSRDDSTTTSADRAETESSTGETRANPGPSDGGGSGQGSAETLQHDLGEFVSWSALHRDISKQLDEGAELDSDYSTPCQAPDDLDVQSGGVASVGTSEKEQATWFVGTDKQTGDQVIVILDSGCDQRVREAP